MGVGEGEGQKLQHVPKPLQLITDTGSHLLNCCLERQFKEASSRSTTRVVFVGIQNSVHEHYYLAPQIPDYESNKSCTVVREAEGSFTELRLPFFRTS